VNGIKLYGRTASLTHPLITPSHNTPLVTHYHNTPVSPNSDWYQAIWKDGIANIDEHLNGLPELGKGKHRDYNIKVEELNNLVWPPSAHAQVSQHSIAHHYQSSSRHFSSLHCSSQHIILYCITTVRACILLDQPLLIRLSLSFLIIFIFFRPSTTFKRGS